VYTSFILNIVRLFYYVHCYIFLEQNIYIYTYRCEQTPVGRRQNKTAKRPAPSVASSVSSSVSSVSESLHSFSTMPTDSKLNMIFQRVEMLGKHEEVLTKLVSNVQQTQGKLESAELCINKHTQYLKKLAYHSIDIEARSRRNNLIFYGLADLRDGDTYGLLS